MPSVDRELLGVPLRAYTARAIAELSATCPEEPPTVLSGFREWVRESEWTFVLRDEPYWVWCIFGSRDVRHAWPEYAAVEQAIRSDPLLATQVETLVGTAFGGPPAGGRPHRGRHHLGAL
jgi:hypothetical protein